MYRNLRTTVISAVAAGAVIFGAATSASAGQIYFNGFETDIDNWFTPTRVPSGTGGIASSAGTHHATDAAGGNPFTRWGGYGFGSAGAVPFQEYKTSIDIYLDVSAGLANDTRFDFTSAINNTAGDHRRDFAFNAGLNRTGFTGGYLV